MRGQADPAECKLSGHRAQSHVTWSLLTAHPWLPLETGWPRQLRAVCCSLFILSSIPSSHLDPVGTHSTVQGSGATTPDHPSVIDPLMEQDEGPGTPPAKQSAPSSRSASACHEPSPDGEGAGQSASYHGLSTSSEGSCAAVCTQAVRTWVGDVLLFLPPSLLSFLAFFFLVFF